MSDQVNETKQKVFEAADKLAAEGTKPTLERVREILNGGSYTTLSKYMKEWRHAQREQEKDIPVDIPEEVETLGKSAIEQIYTVAQKVAQEALDFERDALHQANQEHEEARAEAATLADQADAQLQEARAEITALTKLVKDMETNLEEAIGKAESYAQELTQTQQTLASERSTRVGLENLRDQLQDDIKQAQNNLVAEQQANQQLQSDIAKQAKTLGKEEATNQAHAARIKDLTNERKELKTQLARAQTESKKLTEKANEATLKLTELAGANAALDKEAATYKHQWQITEKHYQDRKASDAKQIRDAELKCRDIERERNQLQQALNDAKATIAQLSQNDS